MNYLIVADWICPGITSVTTLRGKRAKMNDVSQSPIFPQNKAIATTAIPQTEGTGNLAQSCPFIDGFCQEKCPF